MSALSQRILGRLPAHLEATRPGKRLGEVAAVLAQALEGLQVEAGAVRRAHRLGHATEVRDVLALGGVHGIHRAEVALLFLRLAEARRRAAALAAVPPGDDATRAARVAELLAFWPVDWQALGLPGPSLLPFAPPAQPGEPPDLVAAAERLAEEAATSAGYAVALAGTRQRIAEICRIHAEGNGTVGALLAAAANALDLDIVRTAHSADRFWHAALVRDRLPLTTLTAGPGGLQERALPVRHDVLGLEENPPHRLEKDPVARHHAEVFEVDRPGFERVLLQVRVHGLGQRTVGPRYTQLDEAHGVGYAGPPLAAGETLIFAEDGRVRLEGADVTSFAYAWRGGCFADACAPHPRDRVFGDADAPPAAQWVRFAVATPEGALDRGFAFPHEGRPLPMPGIGVGTTRLAFFVQTAHAGHGPEPSAPPGSPPGSPPGAPTERRDVTPRFAMAFFDGSVLGDADHLAPFLPCPTEPGAVPAPAAEVSLSWMEQEAYAVRLWLPPRFRVLEDERDAPGVLSRVVRAVSRFKPAGVDLRAAWISEEWILGDSVLVGAQGDDLLLRLLPGTALWPADHGE